MRPPFTKRRKDDKATKKQPAMTTIYYTVRGHALEAMPVGTLQTAQGGVWQSPMVWHQNYSTDGEVSTIDRAENTALAILDAVQEARILDKRTGRPVDAA